MRLAGPAQVNAFQTNIAFGSLSQAQRKHRGNHGNSAQVHAIVQVRPAAQFAIANPQGIGSRAVKGVTQDAIAALRQDFALGIG